MLGTTATSTASKNGVAGHPVAPVGVDRQQGRRHLLALVVGDEPEVSRDQQPKRSAPLGERRDGLGEDVDALVVGEPTQVADDR